MIRKAKEDDLDTVMPMYDEARRCMRAAGNMVQWINGYPSRSLILKDINDGNFYVIEEDAEIVGAFSFIIGEDPTYAQIEGRWINDEPYGTVHRLVSSGKRKGVGTECLNYCRCIINNVRIDTHEVNLPMRAVIERNGLAYCGIIHLADGTPRLAFQTLT